MTDFLLPLAFIATWYFGFVFGRWWERFTSEEMPDNDEGMW